MGIYFYRGRDRVPYYELKTKDIGKTSVQAVMAPATTLGCQIDEVQEYVKNDSDA